MKTNVTPAKALIDAQRQFDLCDDESRTGNTSEMRPIQPQ
jgi:hypothetical protein